MSYEEEAKWWEAHDLSEVWDELEDVELRIEWDAFKAPRHLRHLSRAIKVRPDPINLHNLKDSHVSNKKQQKKD